MTRVVPHLLTAALASTALAGALVLAPGSSTGAQATRPDNGTVATDTNPAISATPEITDPSGLSTAGAAGAAEAVAAKKTTITYPKAGRQSWKYATGRSKVAGKKGQLLRYRVVVEKGITGITANQFADRVTKTLADKRSWSGTGKFRLQRVPSSSAYDFTIYLATPQTRDILCQDATKSDPDRYTSCRNGNRVVLNVARWAHGVPKFGASLETYRSYMINHETGHRLGYHHEKCLGKGKKAPVMQQQTLGLHGCTANAWPMVNGKLYRGPAGAYSDPIPSA